MVVDFQTFILDNKNYVEKVSDKKQIVIGNSLSNDLKYINGWRKRFGGNYKNTTTFSIDKKGKARLIFLKHGC